MNHDHTGVKYRGVPTRRVFGRRICNCLRCGYVWVARGQEKPQRCAKCKHKAWNRDLEKPGPKKGKRKKKE